MKMAVRILQGIVICAPLALLLTPAKSDRSPATRTVISLYQRCLSQSPSDSAYCAGVTRATWDTLGFSGNFASFCPKTPTSDTDKVDAFRKWAVRHPEMWGKQETFGVVLALQQAWPCTWRSSAISRRDSWNRIACLSVPPPAIFDHNHQMYYSDLVAGTSTREPKRLSGSGGTRLQSERHPSPQPPGTVSTINKGPIRGLLHFRRQ